MTAATDKLDAATPSRPAAASPAVAAWVAYLGAAAFAAAAAWSGLTTRFVTVTDPPASTPGSPPDTGLHRWVAGLVTTLSQQRPNTGLAIAGFLCLGALATLGRDLLGHQRGLPRIGPQALPAGALLWLTGNLAQLAGHRLARLLASHGHPIQTVNTLLVWVGMIDAAFELAAFALLGVALLAFASATISRPAGHRGVPRAWYGYSLLLGAVLLALSGAQAATDGNPLDLLLDSRCPTHPSHLLAASTLLLPAWLLWTGQLLRADHRSRHAP